MHDITSTKLRHAIGILAVTLPMFSPTLTIAQEARAEFDAGTYRIDIAGRQRMLSQRIAKSMCYIHEGIEVDMHIKMLEADYHLFKNSLNELRDGGGEHNLAPETDRRILAELGHVAHTWVPFDEIISRSVKTREVLDVDEIYIGENDKLLLDDADHVVSLIEQEYANPNTLSMASAITLNIFGRQRMLSQRAAKDFCQVYSGHDVNDKRADLAETRAVFTASLDAIQNGMPDFGIAPPPTEEIKAQLAVVAAIWRPMNEIFGHVSAGENPTSEDISTVVHESMRLQAEMNKAVQMYSQN